MYKTIIDIKPDVSHEVLQTLRTTAENAFNNRAGRVKNISMEPYRFIFQGEEDVYGCLQLGNLSLDKSLSFKKNLQAWNWEDEEPGENCDLLEEFAKPVF